YEDAVFDMGLRRQSGQRVITMATRELVKEMRRPFSCEGQFDGDQQFVLEQRGLENALKEVCGRDPPFAIRAARDDRRIKRKNAGREFGGGGGVCQTTPERPPVPDRGMSDMGNRLGQQRCMRRDFRRIENVYMTGQRADTDRVAAEADPAQFGEATDIDNEV